MAKERMTPLILVAEDDSDILGLVLMVLEEDEYEVVTAADGERAIALAGERDPDLCILDVMMPKADGIEVTRRLRAQAATRDVPIILLSARTQWESVARGKEAGADEYLSKPFVPEDLQRSVRSLLMRSRTEEEPVEQPVLELLANAEEEAQAEPAGLVLVAGPDQNLVHLVSYRLDLGGYEVATAHDPEEAMQLVAERQPDLCLLDDSMPDLDGCPTKRIDSTVSVQELYGEVEQLLASPGRTSA
jgi:DNA-binding response OmpR family regulator